MKKITITFLFLVSVFTYAQEIQDALRYSQDNLNGTARFNAMAGAFGALGGDLSAITINPAGSSIFNNNQIGFSLNNNNLRNKSNYFGTQNRERENSLDLNQLSGVFVFYDQTNSKWKKFALALTYENENNFNTCIMEHAVTEAEIKNCYDFFDMKAKN